MYFKRINKLFYYSVAINGHQDILMNSIMQPHTDCWPTYPIPSCPPSPRTETIYLLHLVAQLIGHLQVSYQWPRMHGSIWPITTPLGNPWEKSRRLGLRVGNWLKHFCPSCRGWGKLLCFCKVCHISCTVDYIFSRRKGICRRMVEEGITYQYLSLYLQVCMVQDQS